jgi:hypothetical protein
MDSETTSTRGTALLCIAVLLATFRACAAQRPWDEFGVHQMPLASDSTLEVALEGAFVHVTFTDATDPARMELLRAHRRWRPLVVPAIIGVNVRGEALERLNREGKRFNERYVYSPDKLKREFAYLPGKGLSGADVHARTCTRARTHTARPHPQSKLCAARPSARTLLTRLGGPTSAVRQRMPL